MGCGSSSSDFPIYHQHPPPTVMEITSIKEDTKTLVINAIEHDNLPELAVLMETQKIKPNTQISDPGLYWMSIHFCCRWNAAKCLQYLLKQFYAEKHKDYIKFVNAQTIDGFSCLHLCAIWNAEKCFNLLNNYGGLELDIRDKMKKQPLQTAKDYKREKIASALQQFKDINIHFTNIEHHKLISGSILQQQTKQSSNSKQFIPKPISNKVAMIIGQIVEYAQQQNKIREQKQKIQKQNDQIIVKMKRSKQQAIAKKLLMLSQNNKGADKEILKYDNIINEQDRKMKNVIKQNNQKVSKLQYQLSNIFQKRFVNTMEQENAKIDTYFQSENVQMQQKVNDKRKVVEKFKNQVGSQLAEKRSKLARNQTLSLVVAKIKDQLKGEIPPQFKETYEAAKRAGKFIDYQFPPQLKSIGDIKGEKSVKVDNLNKQLVWMRPGQIFKSDYQLFDNIDPDDIKQGGLGVCYYLATLSVLAKNPQNIRSIFKFYDKGLGFYILRFFVNGTQKLVVIDDYIPCNKDIKEPLFTKPIGLQIWVMLLEKAWAKIIGDYLSAQAMTPDHIMEDLSGAPGYGEWLKNPVQEKIKDIFDHNNKYHAIVITSKPNANVQGISNNHAYSLLDMYDHRGQKLFKIRNPWGRFQWSGKYGEKSNLWTPELKSLVNYKEADDGVFILSQAQLIKAFCYYSISMIRPNYCYSSIKFRSGKRQDVCFIFDLPKDCQLNLRITQPFNRMVKDKSYEYSSVIFEIGKIQSDSKVTFLYQGSQRCYWGAKSVHQSDKIIDKFTKGKYFIRAQIVWKKQEQYNSAVLSAYCQCPVSFQKINEQQAFNYRNLMMIDFAKNKLPNLNKHGKIQYGYAWMKAQMVILIQTSEQSNRLVYFTFDKKSLKNVVLGQGAYNPQQMAFKVKKGISAIGIVIKQVISEGAATGSIQIRQLAQP